MSHDASAILSAFGAEVDDPVGVADHVQIVLDDDDRVAQVGQPVQHFEQFASRPRSAGRWWARRADTSVFPGLALAQFARQLDALGFAAGERDRRLAQMNVAQADVHQRLQLLPDLRDVFQNRQRIGDRRFEQIGDRLAFVFHRERLVVVAVAAADLAQHVNVGQKVHFDPPLAFSLAGFAAPARNVERKASRLVTAFARLRQHGIEIANLGEDAGVGRWIRTRRAANRRLVDANDLVDIFRSGDGLVRSGFFARAVKFLRERAVENVVHQRGFARAGDAGHNRHHAQRESDVNTLEIVLPRPEDGDRGPVGWRRSGRISIRVLPEM